MDPMCETVPNEYLRLYENSLKLRLMKCSLIK